MYIGPTKFFEDDAATANYELGKRLCGESQGLNWSNNREIGEAVADVKENKNKAENP